MNEIYNVFPTLTEKKLNFKFFSNRSGKKNDKYFLLKNYCELYRIEFLENPEETIWNICNPNSKLKCKYEKCDNFCQFLTFTKGYRIFCSTKCSAKFRDNSTRKGFVTSKGFQKYKDTLYKKYGVHHQSHIPECFEKTQNSRYITYEIFSPNNICYKVQGYERYIIPELWKSIDESDLVVSKQKIPKINYLYENKIKKYYPDAYIISNNTLIEVKSVYTLKDIKLKYKIIRALENNYNINIYLYDKGIITILNGKELL